MCQCRYEVSLSCRSTYYIYFLFHIRNRSENLVTWRCWSSLSLNRREAAVLMYFTLRDWLSSLRSHVRIFKVGEDEVRGYTQRYSDGPHFSLYLSSTSHDRGKIWPDLVKTSMSRNRYLFKAPWPLDKRLLLVEPELKIQRFGSFWSNRSHGPCQPV